MTLKQINQVYTSLWCKYISSVVTASYGITILNMYLELEDYRNGLNTDLQGIYQETVKSLISTYQTVEELCQSAEFDPSTTRILMESMKEMGKLYYALSEYTLLSLGYAYNPQYISTVNADTLQTLIYIFCILYTNAEESRDKALDVATRFQEKVGELITTVGAQRELMIREGSQITVSSTSSITPIGRDSFDSTSSFIPMRVSLYDSLDLSPVSKSAAPKVVASPESISSLAPMSPVSKSATPIVASPESISSLAPMSPISIIPMRVSLYDSLDLSPISKSAAPIVVTSTDSISSLAPMSPGSDRTMSTFKLSPISRKPSTFGFTQKSEPNVKLMLQIPKRHIVPTGTSSITPIAPDLEWITMYSVGMHVNENKSTSVEPSIDIADVDTPVRIKEILQQRFDYSPVSPSPLMLPPSFSQSFETEDWSLWELETKGGGRTL